MKLFVGAGFENHTFTGINTIVIENIDSYEIFKNCTFKDCQDICVYVRGSGVCSLPNTINIICIEFETSDATIFYNGVNYTKTAIIKETIQIFHCNYGASLDFILDYFEERYDMSSGFSLINSKNEYPYPYCFMTEEIFTIMDETNGLVIGKAKCLPRKKNIFYETILSTNDSTFIYNGDVTTDDIEDLLEIPIVILEKFETFKTIIIKGNIYKFFAIMCDDFTVRGNIYKHCFVDKSINCKSFIVDGSIMEDAFVHCIANINLFTISGTCHNLQFEDGIIDTLKVNTIACDIGANVLISNLKCTWITNNYMIQADKIIIPNSAYCKHIVFAYYIEITSTFDETLVIRFQHIDSPLIINFENCKTTSYFKSKEFTIQDGVDHYVFSTAKTLIVPCNLIYELRTLVDIFDKREIVEYLSDVCPSTRYDLNTVTLTPIFENIYEVQIFDTKTSTTVTIMNVTLNYNNNLIFGIGVAFICFSVLMCILNN